MLLSFYSIFLVLLLLISLKEEWVECVQILRSPGSNRINVRLQVPSSAAGEGITFRALFPEGQCLTEEPTDNRLFIDLPGCRISLDWSLTLFGTSHYYRKGEKPRVRRKWRVGPVQKLKVGSAIIHYGNDMRVQLHDSGLTVTSVTPSGTVMGPQQAKKFSCPLGLASSGGMLDIDVFSPLGMAKCQIGLEFGPEYKLVSSAERAEVSDGEVLEQEALRD